jgi:hypothetical protein
LFLLEVRIVPSRLESEQQLAPVRDVKETTNFRQMRFVSIAEMSLNGDVPVAVTAHLLLLKKAVIPFLKTAAPELQPHLTEFDVLSQPPAVRITTTLRQAMKQVPVSWIRGFSLTS